ncbi:hypothetical protein SDC9_107817 [bioreactor metagenome]|uniref:Uncharacterized protein n=1 Tax=bioreactor metagenome TaxID=1076179 RepID=A0A645BCQ2_9ZZZZ
MDQPLVDFAEQGGAVVLLHVFHELLVVVQKENHGDRAGTIVVFPENGIVGYVYPVGGGKNGIAPTLGPDKLAEHQKLSAVQCDFGRALIFALQKPTRIKTGHRG